MRRRSRNPIFVGIGIVLVLIVGGLIVTNLLDFTPAVEQNRLELDPVLGAEDAPVTLIEYGAYGCTNCQQWHELGFVENILEEFDGQVKFIFRDNPVVNRSFSTMAAEMSECALDQGQSIYWDFHTSVFDAAAESSSRVLTESELFALANRISMDVEAFRACYNAGTHEATVAHDENSAIEQGFRATPVFTVNGERIFSANPEVLRQAIRDAIEN